MVAHRSRQLSDVPRAAEMYERRFGLECQSNRLSPSIAFLSDGHGFVLVLQRKKNPDVSYPEGFHLGFLVDEVSIVERFDARARQEGLEVSDIQTHNRGTMVFCRAPDGYAIEVSVRRKL